MKELRLEIQTALNCEIVNLEAYGDSVDKQEAPDMYICQGWIEALQYVLRQIDTKTYPYSVRIAEEE